MLINMVLPGAVAAEEPFAFEYSGNFTDNRDADGKGTVRLNTSGTLTVLSGTATVQAYILGAGGGSCLAKNDSYGFGVTGGSGGYQTIEVELTPGTYEIVIGTGGNASFNSDFTSQQAGNGGNTTAFGYTSTGGTGARTVSMVPDGTPGAGGTPNGNAGRLGSLDSPTSIYLDGGSPNGGSVVNSVARPGGNGYVELTFI